MRIAKQGREGCLSVPDGDEGEDRGSRQRGSCHYASCGIGGGKDCSCCNDAGIGSGDRPIIGPVKRRQNDPSLSFHK